MTCIKIELISSALPNKKLKTKMQLNWPQSHSMEKEMAIHSSTLVWKIPWMEECGRLPSMGLQRVRHNWATPLSFFLIVNGNVRLLDQVFWPQVHFSCPCFLGSCDILSELIWSVNENRVWKIENGDIKLNRLFAGLEGGRETFKEENV